MRLQLLLIVAVAACNPPSRAQGGPGDGGIDAGVVDSYVDYSDANIPPRCSSDLHDVLDVHGNVVMTCPDDQGCADGACIAACDAAAASRGSVGCDFIVATPSFYPMITPPCFAVFLANNWPGQAAITIARGPSTFSATTFGRVPDGTTDAASWPAVPTTGVDNDGVAVLFLSDDPSSFNTTTLTCPITPAIAVTNGTSVYTANQRAQTGLGTAWHITTSLPVSAYDIIPYGGALSYLPSAELLLPTTAWGTNYVAAAPRPARGPAWGQVVAAEDHTMVSIYPTVDLAAGAGMVAAPAQTQTSYELSAGEYLQWQTDAYMLDADDMSGSAIWSDKPISFTGGTGYLCVTSATSTGGGCDSAHQMIPPVAALGFEYVAPPYATRRADLQEESINYRLVGMTEGTQLVFDPAVAGAPTTLSAGEVVEFETVGPFIIKSQDSMHPFYVGQYMAGAFVTGASRPGSLRGNLGDEEFVNIIPPEQWLKSYVFFTDPTYATTNLVVVRKAGTTGFADVTIDCLGVIGGWAPVAGGGEYEITNVDLQRIAPVGTCTSGRHTATSAAPFHVMVWGLDYESSYAYPAGGTVGRINPVIVIP